MCLYPQLMRNKKYQANKKNGGLVPPITDQRTLFVPVGCGKCIECRKQKAREWQVRLQEDIKHNQNGKFITLTFSNESITELNEHIDWLENQQPEPKTEGYARDNKIATQAVRWFLENWRKTYGKSLRHWLITELGQEGTENIHIHGIIWPNVTDDWRIAIDKHWKYGYTWTGKEINGKSINYVNEKTTNYITKYVNKVDPLHKNYIPKILTTKGIGKGYIHTDNAKTNKFNGEKTKEHYTTRQGYKLSNPIYYRNHLYTDEQKTQLWINKLNKQVRYVRGEKVDVSKNTTTYEGLLRWHQQRNRELGYGGGENWDEIQYENQRRDMLRNQRITTEKAPAARLANTHS